MEMLSLIKIILFIIIINNSYHIIVAEKIHVRQDLYSSIASLENVLEVEKIFMINLQDFIIKSKSEIESLKKLIQNIQNTTAVSDSVQLPNILVNIRKNVKKYLNNFRKFNEIYDFKIPTISDLNGVISGLIRLQNIYGLTADQIANGNLSDTIQLPKKFKAHDCLIIGQQLDKMKFYDLALKWYKAALDSKNISNTNTFQATDNFETFIDNRIKKISQNLKINTINIDEKLGFDDFNMAQLACRGLLQKSSDELKKLYCKYEINNHAFLRIAPIKVEVLNFSPYLVVFHDIIYDSEIDIIKKLSMDSLERAQAWNVNIGADTVTQYRTSKHTWITNESHPIVHTLNQRMSDMTGLLMETSEDLQIANYGIGGHYDFHHDYSEESDDEKYNSALDHDDGFGKGDRIGTLLFYLSNVPIGGATVWPFINVKVNPVKGSAAFWYNLYSSLQGDPNTLHSACPVVLGSKWAANKWIRSEGQIFRKPCLLDPSQHHIS